MDDSSNPHVIFLFPRNISFPPRRGDSQRVYLIAEATLTCGLSNSVFYFDTNEPFYYSGINFYPIPGSVTIGPLKKSKFSFITAIKDIGYFSAVIIRFGLKIHKNKILYAHTPIGGFIGSLIKPITRMPLIYDPHDWHYDEWVLYHRNLSNLKKIILKFSFKLMNFIIEKFADIIICVSPEMLNEINTKHIKIFIPNYARIENNEQILVDRVIKKNKRSILFVGHIAGYQGIFELLKAFKVVNQKLTNVELQIIGDGEDLEVAKQFAEKEKIENIVFMGALLQKEVYSFIKASSVCVAPFLSTPFVKTSCPLKILEYAALNKKIVTTDVSAFRRILKGYQKAYFFRETVESLSQSILTALQTKDSPSNLNNKKNIEFFNEEYFKEALCKLYRYISKKFFS